MTVRRLFRAGCAPDVSGTTGDRISFTVTDRITPTLCLYPQPEWLCCSITTPVLRSASRGSAIPSLCGQRDLHDQGASYSAYPDDDYQSYSVPPSSLGLTWEAAGDSNDHCTWQDAEMTFNGTVGQRMRLKVMARFGLQQHSILRPNGRL